MRQASVDGPGIVAAFRRFWQRSYAAEYLGIILLLTANVWAEYFLEPVHQMFRLDDRARQYPHALVERVSSLENILFAGVGPLVLLIVWALVFRPGVHKAHVTILGLFISLLLTVLLTDIIKNAIGRPRPDLIARCKPERGTPEHDLITIDVCTETHHHTLHDGWRSFPSGHSSWAFSGLGYLSLFLAGQLHVFRPHADLARVLIFLAPLVGASLVAMSRLADYRHDIYDVTCGSLLGMAVAYTTYRRYYRPLRHLKCDTPYPSRAGYTSKKAPNIRSRDLEEAAEQFELSVSDMSEDEPHSYLLTGSGQADPRQHAGTAEPP
ncbi:Diacylglycerol pyrophosphate phosphatase 1 [Cladophialophora carrionii]|uniref:Diacylglycerol pyrophosphate phosphatase 1 n=1 Tax=Cladophialophora carrionii TaxID=86049 RepID=A0A1C1CYN1_9EURO|nr:Diacylglycerol pyrophosphate phosphatase 1 [Cladophialophora carrionii]